MATVRSPVVPAGRLAARLPFLLLLNFLVWVADMKPIQWILVVVVFVVMVSVVTFVMQFLGEENKVPEQPPVTGDTPPKILLVPEVKYPTTIPGYFESYVDQEKTQKFGYHDFPFSNMTAEDVSVGLNSRSCTICVSMAVVLASDEWKTRAAMLRLGHFMGTFGQPQLAAGFIAAEMNDKGLREAADKCQPAVTLEQSTDPKSEFVLPAHAVGWLRLGWSEELSGKKTFGAEVRMKQNQARGVVRLEARARGVEPVKFVQQEYFDQNISVTDLQQKPKVFWFTMYSTTRSALHPSTALLVPSNWKPEQAPYVVSEPKPIPPEQWYSVQQEVLRQQRSDAAEKDNPPEHIQCAYRFSVTLLDRSVDQKHPFPFGLYRARVRVTFDKDDNVEPMLCYVRGLLAGDVYVATGKDDRINLGSFNTANGQPGESVMLYSEVADLKLEIDKERTPPFLNASLTPDPTDKRAWKLTVGIEPNKVIGTFPRLDDEAYFDTGVYVKTVGNSSRSLRVPVIGTALQ